MKKLLILLCGFCCLTSFAFAKTGSVDTGPVSAYSITGKMVSPDHLLPMFYAINNSTGDSFKSNGDFNFTPLFKNVVNTVKIFAFNNSYYCTLQITINDKGDVSIGNLPNGSATCSISPAQGSVNDSSYQPTITFKVTKNK